MKDLTPGAWLGRALGVLILIVFALFFIDVYKRQPYSFAPKLSMILFFQGFMHTTNSYPQYF